MIKLLTGIVLLLMLEPAFAETVDNTLDKLPPQDITSSLLKVIGGLFVVILAIFGSAWMFRRFGNLNPISNKSLRVIGGITLGQKDRVVLLQVGEEQLLLGVSPGRIQTLHKLEKNIEVEEVDVNKNKQFSTHLSKALQNWKSS